MHMRTVIPAGLLVAGFVAIGARTASACTCVAAITPCQAFEAEIVFVGRVVSSERVGDEFRMRLDVTRAVKGIADPTVELWSSAMTSCGVRLKEGVRYVIYTSKASDGRMGIGACSPTVQLAAGEPDPALPPVPGTIYGTIVRYDIDRIRHFRPLDPIRDVSVSVDVPDGRRSAISDAWGRFVLDRVPPGQHTLAIDAGALGLSPWMAEPVTVGERGACASAHVVLQPAGKVSGRLVDGAGRPASGIYVRLIPDGPAGSLLAQMVDRGAMTDDDGRFAFDGMTPGAYTVAVNPENTPTGQQPFPPTWFGGVDRASATRIWVEGGPVELPVPFVLSDTLPTRTFTFAVTCRDGSVPTYVHATARSAGGHPFGESDLEVRGVHSLTLLRDTEYLLKVTASIPFSPSGPRGRQRRGEELPPMVIPAGEPGRHLALVAPFNDCAAGR
jgi:hypothetical protein